MTHPRHVTPRKILFLTRRTLRRHHLFRPDAEMQQIFTYLLAVMAEKYGIDVHAAVLMSTHEHVVCTDRLGQLPLFLQEFHRLLALATKVHRQWEGPVFGVEKSSAPELITPQAILEKMAYTAVNPVRAGLVHSVAEWPGVSLGLDGEGRASLRVKRPKMYLSPDNPNWPEEATLVLTLPEPLARIHGPERALKLLNREVDQQEAQARSELVARGQRVAGARKVLATKPWARAVSFKPLRGLNPQVVAGRGQVAARTAAITALQTFRQVYALVRSAWARGVRALAFPHGTWAMARYHAALVAPGMPPGMLNFV